MTRRPLLAAALVLFAFAGCGETPVGDGYLAVTVTWDEAVTARCFRVQVPQADGSLLRTGPMARPEGADASLVVGVYRGALPSTVVVEALGYSDDDCEQLVDPPETSGEVEATFPVGGVAQVALRVVVTQPGLDGGVDAGAPDAGGVDAGAPDAGDVDGGPTDGGADAGAPDAGPVVEVCDDGVDNDGDGDADCDDSDCEGKACSGTHVCRSGQCEFAGEVNCADGLDNDGDGATDCEDSDCLGATCTPQDLCLVNAVCAADGTCGSTEQLSCPDEVCRDNGGCAAGVCVSTPSPEGTPCTSTNACITNTQCDGSGACAGDSVVCPPAPMCFINTCVESDGGCAPSPDPGATCDDDDACTLNDECIADGGCTGTPRTCPPPGDCQIAVQCDSQRGCVYTPAASGTLCTGGVCNASGQCLPPDPLFPFTPSNFTEADVRPVVATVQPDLSLVGNCTAVLDTALADGGVAISGCGASMPPHVFVQQPGGPEALVLVVGELTIHQNSTLRVQGRRPLIVAALEGISIAGKLSADAPATPLAASLTGNCAGGSGSSGGSATYSGGGGGGAFGTASAKGGNGWWQSNGGARGSASGNDTLTPLRGGCPGGKGGGGGGGQGGQGGGAVQLTAALNIAISGTVTANGRGAGGGSRGSHGGGGGGSGGGLLLESVTVTSSGRVTANGGGGGEGGDAASAGAAGEDGKDSTSAAGGGWSGAFCSGDGGGGGVRSVVPATGGNGWCWRSGGGGGGGGSVGRIRVNATTCAFSGTVSPAPSSASCP